MIGALQQVLVAAMLTPRDGEACDRAGRGFVAVYAHRHRADAVEIAFTGVVREWAKRSLPLLPAFHVAFRDLVEIAVERPACVMRRLGRAEAKAVGDGKFGSLAEIDLADQPDVALLGM